MATNKNRIKKPFYKQPFSMVVFICLCIYAASFLLPFFWSLLTTFKNNDDYMQNPFGLPLYLRDLEYLQSLGFQNKTDIMPYEIINNEFIYGVFKNYELAWKYITAQAVVNGVTETWHIDHLLFNSLLYSVVSTIITTFAHATTAYVAARYDQFPIIKMLYPIVIIVMILPIVGALPSSLKVMQDLKLYNELWGLWLLKGTFTGTNFLIFYACFKGISWEYAEAAFIDGASHAKVLFDIMLPLATTTTTALAVLSFIGFWNDWNVNVVYMPDFPMLAYSLYKYRTNNIDLTSKPPALIAGCLLVALPMFVFFLIFRDKLMGNVSIGGIKG